MKFTYEWYRELIKLCESEGYNICNYMNYDMHNKSVILRHDVDLSLKKAEVLSEIEKEMNISSTYFILISTDFYNVHTRESRRILQRIMENGSAIGLHFDETQYDINSEEDYRDKISYEIGVLSELLEADVNVVSMHRPSKRFLELNIEFDRVVNAYGHSFFKDMKYLSDSRRNWREDVCSLVKNNEYERYVILTHPFWYSETEIDLKETVDSFISSGNIDRYDSLNSNFRDLQEVVERGIYGI